MDSCALNIQNALCGGIQNVNFAPRHALKFNAQLAVDYPLHSKHGIFLKSYGYHVKMFYLFTNMFTIML